jgi:hypothetical protein
MPHELREDRRFLRRVRDRVTRERASIVPNMRGEPTVRRPTSRKAFDAPRATPQPPMSDSIRSIAPPPSSRRTPPTHASFFRDLLADLTLRLEWLEQVIDGVREPEASSSAVAQLRGWSKAMRDLHAAVTKLQLHLDDKRFASLFELEGALAAFLSRLYAWCEEISTDFESIATKLRRSEPVLAVFSHRNVSESFSHFQELGEALRESLAVSRPRTPDAQSAWTTFDADFEELLWATEWLHMSLAKQPGS